MEISRQKLDAIENALNRLHYDDFESCFDFVQDYYKRQAAPRNERKSIPLSWNVKFYGDRLSPEQAIGFCEKIKRAAEMIKALNDLELIEPEYDTPTDEERETHKKACENAYLLLKLADVDILKTWISNGKTF